MLTNYILFCYKLNGLSIKLPDASLLKFQITPATCVKLQVEVFVALRVNLDLFLSIVS